MGTPTVTPAAPTPAAPGTLAPTLAPQAPTPAPPGPGGSKSFEQEIPILPSRPPATPKKPSSTLDLRSRGSSGLLSVEVPGASEVYINGHQTRAAGSHREFVSYGLKGGKIYPYTIRALVLASGSDGRSGAEGRRWVWITKTVYLRAGQRVGVTFSENLDLESQLAQIEPANSR